MTTATIDQARVEAFVGKVLTDTSGLMTTVMAAIGDRVGLFKDLAAKGPATSAELAARSGLNERYTRERLAGMHAAGYVEYDPASERFTLPPEHVPALADEGGPAFFGGVHQETLGALTAIPAVVTAFQRGGGMPLSAYDANLWQGIERFTSNWFDNLLLPVWMPLLPEVREKLERGAIVADVGCGAGRAVVALAKQFPRSRFVGYDILETQIEAARRVAAEAGVADRVQFEVGDVAAGIPGEYDVVTVFDVVHDAVNPRALLRAIRQSLKPDGILVALEVNCSDRLEENTGPVKALLYGFSLLLCMTSSLAGGGEGLGTCGLPEPVFRALCADTGFGGAERIEMENPFNNLYVARP